jgi:hypothetical protein
MDLTIQMAAPANPNLRSCPSCDAGVSVFAANCPGCGHPFRATTARPFTRTHGITVFICALVVIFGSLLWVSAASRAREMGESWDKAAITAVRHGDSDGGDEIMRFAYGANWKAEERAARTAAAGLPVVVLGAVIGGLFVVLVRPGRAAR